MIHEFYDEHGLLEPGVRRTIQHGSAAPKFEIIATLKSLTPERWRAEVTLFGATVVKLDRTFPSKQAAGAAAEAALQERMVAIFAS
ncbi:hypothetical protein DEU35_1344 [Microbacterium sp. AG157]|uniref:hypothetical protein n=1 Tax=Microbacterium sp. AG157 TaxID=2183993 RepID=UPI000E21CD69|nr:hypothetical protein [Microbacterium sp. AG157]REC98249.1 hypothetical protein DEU35_1344 [Microbacterium sp. AG157]